MVDNRELSVYSLKLQNFIRCMGEENDKVLSVCSINIKPRRKICGVFVYKMFCDYITAL